MNYTNKTCTLLMSALALLFSPCQASQDKTSVQSENNAHPSQKEDFDIVLLSEAFGHFIGKNLNSPGVNFDLEAMVKGIREGAAGKPAPMSDKDYEMAMTKLQERALEQLSSDNLKAANDFIHNNAKNQGVVEIEPGKLQYITLQEGNGDKVEPHSTPLIHYTGRYLDGKIFGCSQEVGGPITIALDQTIPGFSKGLVGMKENEKRRLFIHPDLGYGTLGNLPPNALLIFDIEIVKADSQKENPHKDLASDEDEDEDEDESTLSYNDDEGTDQDDDNDHTPMEHGHFEGGSLKR